MRRISCHCCALACEGGVGALASGRAPYCHAALSLLQMLCGLLHATSILILTFAASESFLDHSTNMMSGRLWSGAVFEVPTNVWQDGRHRVR